MGNHISQQLAMFLRSIALGGALGLVYDLLRALRRLGGPVWGGLLDGVYCFLAAGALFLFTMAGDGELRIFVLAGALGGAVLFFCLLSRPLRPLWDFWLEILLSPLRLLKELLKKCWRRLKKLFSFSKRWVTMVLACWRERHPPAPQEGDVRMNDHSNGKKRQKKQKKRPSGKLTILILAALLAGLGFQLYHQYDLLRNAMREEAAYAARLAELQETNARLAADIENRDNLDLIEDIARDELGMVREGEKVFYFSK